MIAGIGTDIVAIDRMRAALQRHGSRLAGRILHAHERTAFDGVADKAAFLARRFAAKEAVAKALGTGIGGAVRLAEIEVAHDEAGKPLLRLHGRTAATALQRGVTVSHISIADERDYALAFVVLSGVCNTTLL